MSWTSGVVLYILIWWVALFAILPIGSRPKAEADESSGWRGAPMRPRLGRALLLTTIVSAVLWGVAALVIVSEVFSFRHGLLAPHRP